MDKTRELENLFKKWEENGSYSSKGQRGQFIKDGIVCLKRYEKSAVKVLFVLKDTNDANPQIYYERGICEEVVLSDNSGASWNRISEWARALVLGEENFLEANCLKKEEIDEEDEKDGLRKYFKKIAIMNLKKASGKGSIGYKELEPYVIKDVENIRKEIEIISPDVIIACSSDVFELLHKEVFKKERYSISPRVISLNNKMKDYGNYFDISSFLCSKKPVYVIKYCHPNNRGRGNCSKEEHYENMLKIRTEIYV